MSMMERISRPWQIQTARAGFWLGMFGVMAVSGVFAEPVRGDAPSVETVVLDDPLDRELTAGRRRPPVLSEKVGESTWYYFVTNNEAHVGTGDVFGGVAVKPAPVGRVEIPARLGGLPVTGVGGTAFYEMPDLTEVVFPPTIRHIDMGAFYECPKLERLDIPEGVRCVEARLCFGCVGLRSVSVPASATNIWFEAFYDCTNLQSVTLSEGIRWTDAWIFAGCSNLTNLVVPASLTWFAPGAFYACAPAFEVAPGNPSYVAEGGVLFSRDRSLLVKCPRSTKVLAVPATVKAFDSSAFDCCDALEAVEVAPDNAAFRSQDGILYTKDGATLLRCPMGRTGTVRLAEGTQTVAAQAFAGCSRVTDVVLPPSLRSIGDLAFAGCSGLRWIVLPESLAHLGVNSFAGCPNLFRPKLTPAQAALWRKAVGEPEEKPVEEVEEEAPSAEAKPLAMTIEPGRKEVREDEFRGRTDLSAIVIPDSVETIGEHAFYGCTGLTNVVFGSGLRHIDTWAFSGCSALREVDLPAGVTNVASLAFSGCTGVRRAAVPQVGMAAGFDGLEELVLREGTAALDGSIYNVQARRLVLPESLRALDLGTCARIGGLERLLIPAGVTNVTIGCCLSSRRLPPVEVDAGNVCYVGRADGLYSRDGRSLVKWFADEEAVRVPDGVVSVGGHAFSGNHAIRSIAFPSSVETVDVDACCGLTGVVSYAVSEGCRTLCARDGILYSKDGRTLIACPPARTDVTVPPGVTAIGDRAFRQCGELTSVVLPEGLRRIGDDAFLSCSALRELVIPEGVESIGRAAFRFCSDLSFLEIPGTVTSLWGSSLPALAEVVLFTGPRPAATNDVAQTEMAAIARLRRSGLKRPGEDLIMALVEAEIEGIMYEVEDFTEGKNAKVEEERPQVYVLAGKAGWSTNETFCGCSVVALPEGARETEDFLRDAKRVLTLPCGRLRWKAERGDVAACRELAAAYLDETKPAGSVDPKRAMDWYQRAADQGDLFSQLWVGIGYWEGQGRIRDRERANRLFAETLPRALECARKNDALAMEVLAIAYENGYGVARSVPHALKWYRKLSSAGHDVEEAIKRLEGENADADEPDDD